MEHDVLTCALQHSVSSNRQMVLQFWFIIILFKIHSTKKIYNSWRRDNLDVLVQHVEHDVPACLQCNIWPWSSFHNGRCLVQNFLLNLNQICCRLFGNVCVISLTAIEDRIRFKWKFKFEFEIQQIISFIREIYGATQIQLIQILFWTNLSQISQEKRPRLRCYITRLDYHVLTRVLCTRLSSLCQAL